MKAGVLQQALDDLARKPGVEGCALVEIDAGMVWHAAGHTAQMQVLSEACSDYWRLYLRLNRHFSDLGDMRAAVFMHASTRITLLPCGKGMLLVALTRENSQVNWADWQTSSQQLAQQVDMRS